MAESVTGKQDDRAGDWSAQLARFVHRVSSDSERRQPLDAEEEEALELLVRALVGAGPLRTPRQGTFEGWVAVLERLRLLGYVRGSGAWYHPTLAGIRRGLLLIPDETVPGESTAVAGVAFWPVEKRCTCKMLTKHSGPDLTPDVARARPRPGRCLGRIARRRARDTWTGSPSRCDRRRSRSRLGGSDRASAGPRPRWRHGAGSRAARRGCSWG